MCVFVCACVYVCVCVCVCVFVFAFAGTNLGDATLKSSLKDRERVVELHGRAHCTGSERDLY